MTKFERDDSNEDYIKWSFGQASVYLARDEFGMVWFDSCWDAIEILKEYDMLQIIELMSDVNATRQQVLREHSS